MDFGYSPEEEAFRGEVRAWIKDNLPREWTIPEQKLPRDEQQRFKISLEWQRKLYARGWVGLSWPKAYGGGGGTLMQEMILAEELAKAEAPPMVSEGALEFLGSALLMWGTEEQKQRFLPKALSGDEIWCQGFSEPEAGSDLASLKTRAVADGDDYVVDGQKLWSSHWAELATWLLTLVRTDPEARKHRGITCLLVNMYTPGIEIRPLRQITGDSELAEIFFDNVRVPRSNRVGEENNGWKIAMSVLGLERTRISLFRTQYQTLRRTVELARRVSRHGAPTINDFTLRQRLAQCVIECQIVRLNLYRHLFTVLEGQPEPVSLIQNVFCTEAGIRLTELATQIMGVGSLMTDSAESRLLNYEFLMAKGEAFSGGTPEIHRNVIGERALGIPK